MANKTFGRITVKAAGTTFDNRQGKLYNVRRAEHRKEPVTTYLRREPKNERDKYAIAVLAKAGGTVAKIGYVPSNKAFWLAQRMDAGLIVRGAKGTVTGGSGKARHLGYTFDIVYELVKPDAIAIESDPCNLSVDWF